MITSIAKVTSTPNYYKQKTLHLYSMRIINRREQASKRENYILRVLYLKVLNYNEHIGLYTLR